MNPYVSPGTGKPDVTKPYSWRSDFSKLPTPQSRYHTMPLFDRETICEVAKKLHEFTLLTGEEHPSVKKDSLRSFAYEGEDGLGTRDLPLHNMPQLDLSTTWQTIDDNALLRRISLVMGKGRHGLELLLLFPLGPVESQ